MQQIVDQLLLFAGKAHELVMTKEISDNGRTQMTRFLDRIHNIGTINRSFVKVI